ncbi:MAG: zinc ribbon domain-containing protein [Solirubrobacteraceae bacterium]
MSESDTNGSGVAAGAVEPEPLTVRAVAEPAAEPADGEPTDEAAEPGEEPSPAAPTLEALEQELGFRLIVYWAQPRASMAQSDAAPMHTLLEQMGHQEQLGLVLGSSGGDSDAAHVLSSALHEYTDHLHIYIPKGAYSAATLLALSANTLWMGPSSEMSPIDPQVAIDRRFLVPSPDSDERAGDEEPVYVAAHAIRDFLELSGVTPSTNRPPADTKRLRDLLEPLLNPWILGWYEHADKASRFYAKEALTKYLLAGNDDAVARADTIIATLLDEYASHEAGILRGPARSMGIPVQDAPVTVWSKLKNLAEIYGALPPIISVLIETTEGHEARTVAMRTCEHCGGETLGRSDFHFCPMCGAAFDPRCTHCGGVMIPQWRYCGRCGTAASPTATA